MDSQRVLVTGATGFIGGRLVGLLKDGNADVACLVRDPSRLQLPGTMRYRIIVGDITDPASLGGVTEGGFDLVFHLAGRVRGRSDEDFIRTNVEGTVNLLSALRENRHLPRRIVLTSSLAAGGPCDAGRPVMESDPPRPLGSYGTSKCMMEGRAHGFMDRLPITIVRPPAVYGPGDTMTLVIFRMVRRGIVPMVGGFDNPTSLIYVDDLVRGMVDAALQSGAEGRTYYLADHRVYTYRDVIDAIERCLGSRALKITVPGALARVAATLAEGLLKDEVFTRERVDLLSAPGWACSPEAAQRDLGFSSRVPLDEGIGRTVRWYREAGWL